MSEPLLRVEDLSVEFRTPRGTLRAVDGVSLDVHPGEVHGLVGESGCGKTVTGLSILRLLPPTGRIVDGRIAFEGRDVRAASGRELRRIRGARIGMVFQDPAASMNPVFTVGQQIEKVVRTHLGVRRREAASYTLEALDAVGLPDIRRVHRSYPHELSGGMKQRVMVAMALACRPSLLIADEPTTALDVTIQAQILELIDAIRRRFELAVILVTHDLGVVAQLCDRVSVLYAGKLVETAPTPSLVTPRHPYTQGLVAAVPRPEAGGALPDPIPGSVPSDPGALPGCRFAPRCPHATDRCRASSPPLYEVGLQHRSACYLAEESTLAGAAT